MPLNYNAPTAPIWYPNAELGEYRIPPYQRVPPGTALLADFERNRFYIDGLGFVADTEALDITRNTSKYVFQPDGAGGYVLTEVPPNVLAYEYDPVTGERRLSVEGSATNVVTDFYGGSDFSDALGVELQASVEPLFSSTFNNLVKVASSGTTAGSFIERNFSYSGTESFAVYKCIVKNNGGFQGAQINSNGLPLLDFNVVDGVVTYARPIDSSGTAQMRGYKITPLPDDKYRIEVAVKREGMNSFFSFRIYPYDDKNRGIGTVLDTQQTIGNGLLISGFELIKDTNVLGDSFIITNGTTKLRAADIVTSDAATFGDWFTNPVSGSLNVKFTRKGTVAAGQDAGVISLNDGTSNNFLTCYINDTDQTFRLYGNSAGGAFNVIGSVYVPDSDYEIELRYSPSGCELYINGVLDASTASTINANAFTQLQVGGAPVVTNARSSYELITFKPSV